MLHRMVKRLFFGRGERPRAIWFGLAKRCVFIIDPANKSQRIVGLDEAEITNHLRRYLRRSRTFIDVGASDGYYPIVAKKLNPSLVSIGCEPQQLMHERFSEN